jgi:anti-sigma factor RsiW
MSDNGRTELTSHGEAEELLPWYANGQLDEADRAIVDAHLTSCAYCRQQLAIERRLIEEFQAIEPEIESGWTRLRGRFASDNPVPTVKASRPARLAEAWAFLTRPAVATLAAAQLAFFIVAGSALLWLSRPAYHVLGSPPPAAAGNLIIMFRADATEQDIRDVLKSAGATIVDGPTPANAYVLHVATARRQMALETLQANDNVQLAQPIDGGGS